MTTGPIYSHARAKLRDPAASRTLPAVKGAFEHQLFQVGSRFDATPAPSSSDRSPAGHGVGKGIEPSGTRDSDVASPENIEDVQRPSDQHGGLGTSMQQNAGHGDRISEHGMSPVAEQPDHQAEAGRSSGASTHSGGITPVVSVDESQTNDSAQAFSQQSAGKGPLPTMTLQATQAASQFQVPTASLSASAVNTATPPATDVLSLTQPLSSEDQVNVVRVVRGIANAVNQNGGSIMLRLQPPDLGFVRVQLDIAAGTVHATFQSEQPVVRTLLAQQMGQLRMALESHGLQVERLDVQMMQSNDNSTNTEPQSDDVADDGRSRGAFEDETRQDDSLEHQSQERNVQQGEDVSFEQELNAVA